MEGPIYMPVVAMVVNDWIANSVLSPSGILETGRASVG